MIDTTKSSEVAKILGLPEASVRLWAWAKNLPKENGAYVWTKAQIDEFAADPAATKALIAEISRLRKLVRSLELARERNAEARARANARAKYARASLSDMKVKDRK